MKIYLAAAFSRREEMKQVREELQALGVTINSRWLDEKKPDDWSRERYLRETSLVDVADVRSADMIVRFTDKIETDTVPAYLISGARMFEFGLAWGLGTPIVVVGGMQNVFDRLPNVTHLEDLNELKSFIEAKHEL